jgi:lysozyme family protein
MSDPFTQAFGLVVGHEGGFSAEPGDAGNWTSGVVGHGTLRGSKFGISAAAYPTLDIANLTLPAAELIYRRDYWQRISGDVLPPGLALLVFDAAVNNGVDHAVRWLQVALGVEVDGDLGPQTRGALQAAVKAGNHTSLCVEFHAQRMNFMAGLATWRSFGLGWARRLCSLPYQSLTMGGA